MGRILRLERQQRQGLDKRARQQVADIKMPVRLLKATRQREATADGGGDCGLVNGGHRTHLIQGYMEWVIR